MVANQGKITKLAATPNAGLIDGTDNIHSGIVKALQAYSEGDICIGHAGFTITDGGTYTQYNLAQPIHFTSKGQYATYGTNLDEAYSSTVQHASHTRYDWVLLNPNIGGNPSLSIVQGTAAATPLVADITAGYIPIALVKITAGTNDDKADYDFQLFTLDKQKNSVSIGYDAGSYYAESGNITGDGSGITVTPTLGGVIIDKDRAATVVSAEDITTLKIDFDRATQDSGTAAHNDIGIDLDVTSSSKGTSTAIGMDVDVVGAGSGTQTVTGLDVTVSGGDTNYAALFNGGHVGIGETTPDAPLHIKYALNADTTPALIVESTDAGTNSSPDIKFLRTSSSPADDDYVGQIIFAGMNDAGTPEEIDYAHIYCRIFDKSDSTEDGGFIFRTKVAGADNDTMHIRTGRVGIGASNPSAQLHIKETAVSNYDPDDYVNLIIEDDDARMQLVSNNVGNNGTNIIMTNIDGSTHHNWAIGTATTAQDNILHIGYNTATDDAGAYSDSDFTITKTGLVGIGTRAPDSMLEISKDTDAELIALKLTNQSDAASTAGKVSIQFDLEDTGGNAVDSGKIQVLKEQSFTATGSTQDSAMVFSTSLNGTLTEAIRITSDGKLRVAGNVIQASDGGATITMDTSDNVSVAGGITAGTTVTATTGLITNGYTSLEPVEVNNSGAGAGGVDSLSLSKTIVCLNHASSTAHNYRLPAASGVAQMFFIFKNISDGTVTIIPNNSGTGGSGSDVLDGGSSTAHPLVTAPNVITLTTMQSITLMAYTDGQFGAASGSHGLNGTEGWITLPSA